MASFYAELHVAGHSYPLRLCSYAFTQATGARGRVVAKVRHGLVYLTMDVPDGDFLPVWAATPHKPLAGHITFFEADQRTARETLSWEAGECVRYDEEFRSGDDEQGAYVCHLTIAAPKLTPQAGGAGRYVSPVSVEYGTSALLPTKVLPAVFLDKETQSLLKNDADPLHDLLGPGRISHSAEWENTITTLQAEGVDVVFRSGVMAYGPQSAAGTPGRLIIDPEASIGALRHEAQHYFDDKAAGFPGMKALLHPPTRWKMEYRAYMQEVTLTRELRAFPTGKQLLANARAEKELIVAKYGPVK